MKFVKKSHCTKNGTVCRYFGHGEYMLIEPEVVPCNWCTRASDIPARDYHNFNWKD